MDHSKLKSDLEKDRKASLDFLQTSNPLGSKTVGGEKLALNNYSQTSPRQQYDKDIAEILEVVRILNNMAPIRMPEYNFNIDEINGEYYYKPDGSLLLVREYDRDTIRDYYAEGSKNAEYTVSRILEHDKNSGRLKTKIEPITKKGANLKTNITIFDLKINNKYIIIQLAEEGIVSNISEFTGKGKSFQTLFRNISNQKPARYLEGKDSSDGFEMIDCIFDSNGQIARIKKYSNNKEINIDYTNKSKNISVKGK